MILEFYKYHGAGNDFIIIDNTNGNINNLNNASIHFLCNRNLGIGADGLIIVESNKKYDFEMKYFNSDGYPGTMCGNGGRCISHFVFKKSIVNKNKICFLASDGIHNAELLQDNNILLYMKDVNISEIRKLNDNYFIDTGSPHVVTFSKNILEIDVLKDGKKIRYDKKISENGVNVNFVEVVDDSTIKTRTYERGVENETLSCGTGAIACSLIFSKFINTYSKRIIVETLGGELKVNFEKNEHSFFNIKLEGPAEFVFKGVIEMV
jgi:diaminopimelate epimerase